MTRDETPCVLPHFTRDPATGEVTEDDRPRRALDGLYVCHGHRDRLERNIAEMPRLHDDLIERLAGNDHGAALTREDERWPLAVADHPLPIAVHVVEHRDQMRHVVASWASLTAEERGLATPGTPMLSILSTWLLAHLDWACAQLWVDEFYAEIAGLATRARALIAANPRRRFVVGSCPMPVPLHREHGQTEAQAVALYGSRQCTGVLSARLARGDDLLPSAIECDQSTEHVWTAHQWVALGRRIHGPSGIHPGGAVAMKRRMGA